MSSAPAECNDAEPASSPSKALNYDPVAAWTLLLIVAALILFMTHSRGGAVVDDPLEFRRGGDVGQLFRSGEAPLYDEYVAQLYNGSTRDGAEDYGDAIRRRHRGLIAGLDLTVEDAGRRGYASEHRVLVGPFSKKRDAEALCRAFKMRDVDCFPRLSREALD
jgi:hypothetical protein